MVTSSQDPSQQASRVHDARNLEKLVGLLSRTSSSGPKMTDRNSNSSTPAPRPGGPLAEPATLMLKSEQQCRDYGTVQLIPWCSHRGKGLGFQRCQWYDTFALLFLLFIKRLYSLEVCLIRTVLSQSLGPKLETKYELKPYQNRSHLSGARSTNCKCLIT